jgi:glutathione S-transferase
MTEPEITLVGRSSSHFTRTARLFALETEVPHAFRPVMDLTVLDAANYAGNPALKVPVLLDAQGALYGTENICRELARRSAHRSAVVLRGEVSDRLVANAEELLLHAMGAEVILITSALPGQERPAPAKVVRSLENSLAFLDSHVDRARAALPADRRLSFLETGLYCLVTHLPFRNLMDVSGHARLQAFCAEFGARPGARATPYRFDAPA